MTTPTQAQIEAAAKVVFELEGFQNVIWQDLSEDDRDEYQSFANQILTAAAEVGNADKVCEGYGYGWRAAFESTIELCVQKLNEIADRMTDAVRIVTLRNAAEDLRTLKEKPSIDPNLIYPGKDADFIFPEE